MQHESAVDQVAAVHAVLVQLARELIAGERDTTGGLSFAQHSALSFIARNPGCRATDIADAFGVHRSTVSRQLRVFVESGWVRTAAGSLRSGFPLELTAEGVVALEAADRERLEEVRARVHGWTPAEVAQFAHTLNRFRDAAVPVDASDAPTRVGDDAHA